MVCIHIENQDQASFCPSAPREFSILPELALGQLRYALTGVPPSQTPHLPSFTGKCLISLESFIFVSF